MIPEEKREAVVRALEGAFGVRTYDDIEMLTKGLSTALVFRIVVAGESYVLRVITRTDAIADPTREFICMRAAAEAGIAPRVWYTSIEDRISITGFVKQAPFTLDQARTLLPRSLRALHALPAFPRAYKYFDFVDTFVNRFQQAKLLPQTETEEPIAAYRTIAAVYPRDQFLVSSHNDLKPENILFDGQRPWIADWEAACLNDGYLDLAIVANFVIRNDDEERAYLTEYLGAEPDDYQLARFYLMQQILHMAYGAVFITLAAAGQPVNAEEPVPAFRDFHNRIWDGEISLAGRENKILYGRTHLEELARNIGSPRLQEAMAVVTRNGLSAGLQYASALP